MTPPENSEIDGGDLRGFRDTWQNHSFRLLGHNYPDVFIIKSTSHHQNCKNGIFQR